MTDEAIQVPTAESSPAPVTIDSNIDRLKSMSADDRAHWRMTGELPEDRTQDQPTTEDSATSDKSKETASEDVHETTKTAPDSDPDKSESGDKPKHKGGFQKRIDTLTGRNRTLAGEVEAKDAELRKLREQLAGKPAAEPAKEKPAVSADGRPKVDDFKTYDEYVEALSDWKTRQTLQSERAKAAKEATDAEQKKVFDSHLERLEDARGRYEDFDDVVGRNIPLGGNESTANAAQVHILEMENGPDVAYAIASDPDLATELAGITRPNQVIAYLTRLSDRLAAASDKAEPAEKKADAVAPLVRKKVTSAPPPPVQVGGRQASPEDEAEAALKRGDFAAYKRIQNSRDVARNKG